MGPASVPRQRWLRVAAALAVVAVASITAWTLGHRQGAQALLDGYMAGNEWVEPSPRAVAADEQRIVLHLASGDIERLRRSLDQAELILAGFEYSSHPPQVELIANGEGLNLFRTDTTPFAARIEQLRSNYPSLGLVACARGIERLRDAGIEVEILPGVDTGSVAIERIYTRMRQGWRYEEI
jgi:intracellular sulfur oxidation DsrE/DsrF family protein